VRHRRVLGKKRVVPVIIEGLRKLEYRGYDSAGIAAWRAMRWLQIRRAEGKLATSRKPPHQAASTEPTGSVTPGGLRTAAPARRTLIHTAMYRAYRRRPQTASWEN